MQIGIGIGLPQLKQFKAAGGGGSAYDPAADAIFASFTTPPDTARKGRINDYVVAGKAGGWWGKGDANYKFMAADAQAALINWAQPGTYNGVAVNSPTFTADQGFTSATTKYIDTGFNAAIAPSPKYGQNSATVFAWEVNNIAADGGIIGTGSSGITPRYSTNITYSRVNVSLTNIAIACTDSSGFWLSSRTASNLTTVYKNGVSIGTGATASEAILNAAFTVLAGMAAIAAGITAASAGILSGLSSGEQLSLYQAELAYQAGVATDKIVASFTTPPTAGRKTLIYQYVYDMMAAGAWGDADADYWFAAADAQASLINLVKPGTFNAVAVNSPTFTADQGFTGGATKYIDSNFNPTTAPSPKYTQNDAMISGWSLSSADTSYWMQINAAGWTVFQQAAGALYAAINGNTNNSSANASFLGSWLMTRTASNSISIYKNGSLLVTHAQTSAAIGNNNIWWLNGAGQIASGGIGASRDATKQLAVYNAKRAYATGVGIP